MGEGEQASMKILDYNHCNLDGCLTTCGWNISLGGDSVVELLKLKRLLADIVDEDLTDYDDKLRTEDFFGREDSDV